LKINTKNNYYFSKKHISFFKNEKEFRKNCLCIDHPWIQPSIYTICKEEKKNTNVMGSIISYNDPFFEKKGAFLINKKEIAWKIPKRLLSSWFSTESEDLSIYENWTKNTSFLLKTCSITGVMNLFFKKSKKIMISKSSKFFKNKLHIGFSQHFWSLRETKVQWKYAHRAHKNLGEIYLLAKRNAEIRKNPTSGEFFLVPKHQFRTFHCPQIRWPRFLGSWKTEPNCILMKVLGREIGQTVTIGRNFLTLRPGNRILLERDNFFPWKTGSILDCLSTLTVIRDRAKETEDITSGIPQIESLLEVREKTGIPFFLNILYQKFLQKGFLNRKSARKTLHFRQRVLVDGVQKVYQNNGVNLSDKHLELIVCPISFVEIIQDCTYERPIETKGKYPFVMLESESWYRALLNWQNKKFLFELKPIIFFKPILFGLTKGALHNASFLSAASFQEAPRVLVRAALAGQFDSLLGLKENLILGTRLPIGTNAHILNFNTRSKYNISIIATKSTNPHRSPKNIDKMNRGLLPLWPERTYHLGGTFIREDERNTRTYPTRP
jgi:hypothetical protein